MLFPARKAWRLSPGVLVFAGAGEELAYVADILQGNPALTASAKLPSAPREIIYGETRKGGVFIYQSTTGHQLNEVIVWSAKPCEAIVALYVDQRKHYYSDDSDIAQRSPYGGGQGNGTTYQDDSGNNYNFAGQVSAHHTLGRRWDPTRGGLGWSAGMVAYRGQVGDNASSFDPTTIGVAIGGTTYVFACVVAGTAGSSSSVFSGASAVGTVVNDGSAKWVNCGPAPGGYWFTQLHNQDSTQWANNCLCTGLCATYLKLEYDSNLFYGPPQVRATIKGKNDIYDPRTHTYGYTNNAALVIADFMCDPEFGFGVTYATGIDEDQLIAAANICDEQVQLADASQSGQGSGYAQPWQPWHTYAPGNKFTAAGTTWTVVTGYTSEQYFGENDPANITSSSIGITGASYESRYTINGWFNADQEPGQVLASMLMAMEGRVTRQGGVYKIYPAAWYGTSLTFGADDLCGGVKWQPSRKFRDRINCVRSTFVCPQYPYQLVGYDNDHRDPNIFAGEFQPTDAPPYAQDYLHGYGTIGSPYQGDVNLQQDGGTRLYIDRRYQFVTSGAQVQRLMKIFLLRNRFEGSGTFPMKLTALQAQCEDVINFNFAALQMADTYLQVRKFDWVIAEDDQAGGGDGARPVRITTQLEMELTDPSIYSWSPAEEMTLFDQPSPYIENAFNVSPPTGLAASSDLTTALVGADGLVTPRILLFWTEPDDPFVTTGGTIQVQISPNGANTWVDAAVVSGNAHTAYLLHVVSGDVYDVRIRAVRASGAYSAWLQLSDIMVGTANSTLNQYSTQPYYPLSWSGPTTINLAATTVTYPTHTAAYAARTLTVPAPSSPVWYYVTLADPTQQGEPGSPVLVLSCRTDTSLVGVLGNIYLGAIQAVPAGTDGMILAGGWPAPRTVMWETPLPGWGGGRLPPPVHHPLPGRGAT